MVVTLKSQSRFSDIFCSRLSNRDNLSQIDCITNTMELKRYSKQTKQILNRIFALIEEKDKNTGRNILLV